MFKMIIKMRLPLKQRKNNNLELTFSKGENKIEVFVMALFINYHTIETILLFSCS